MSCCAHHDRESKCEPHGRKSSSRHKNRKAEDRLVNFVCSYVNCVAEKATSPGRQEKVGIIKQASDEFPSEATVRKFFPEIHVSFKVVNNDISAAQAQTIVGDMYRQGVRKFLLIVQSRILQDAFIPILPAYPSAVFVNTNSTLPTLRLNVPPNLFFSLQTDDFFVPSVLSLRPDAATDAWLVTSDTPDAYQQYVKSVAVSFGVQVVTPSQIPSVADQLARAAIVYINLFDAAEQLLTASILPDVRGSVVFLDVAPRTQSIVDAFPTSVFQIVTFSPGTGTSTYEQSQWSEQNSGSSAVFPSPKVMSVYYYLAFINRWDTFAKREIIVQSTVDYPFYIILNKRSP